MLRISQSSSSTGTSPSDCLVSYPGHWLGGGLTPPQKCSRCILQPQPTIQRGRRGWIRAFQNVISARRNTSSEIRIRLHDSVIQGDDSSTHTHTHTHTHIYIYVHIYIRIHTHTHLSVPVGWGYRIHRLHLCGGVRTLQPVSCPVSWGCRIHWLHLCKGIRLPPRNECPGYDTKQSDGEVPAVL